MEKKRSLYLDTRYDIIEKLGEGGFGSIYKVKDSKNNEYAVKELISNNKGIPCLMEISIMMSYQHTYINSAIKTEIKGDKLYIFQDIACCNLHEWVKTVDITQNDLLFISFCVLNAINFLHKENIIHGDIKSSNILVFPGPIFKLSDFNLSSKIEWKSKLNICSPNFRPLEGWAQNWDEKVDIWAAGCTLYFLKYKQYLFPSQEKDIYTHLRYVRALYDWQEISSNNETDISCQNETKNLYRNILGNINIDISYRKLHLKQGCELLTTKDPYLYMIREMLHINPNMRPTPGQCLQKQFFKNIKTKNMVSHIRRLNVLKSNNINIPLDTETKNIFSRFNIVNTNIPTIMSNYTTVMEIAILSQRIYDRYIPYKSEQISDHVLCVTILWIVRKLIHYTEDYYKLPGCAKGLSYNKICEIERDIFRKLGSMFH